MVNTLGIVNLLLILLIILNVIELIINITTKEIKFIKLKEDVKIPTKDYENAGYDIYANFDEENFVIEPHTTKLVPTKLSTIFSPRFVMILKERGSTGSRGIALRCGVVDSSYRGEIFVCLTNTNDKPLVITKEQDTSALEEDYIVYPYKKAIAQAVMLEIPNLRVKEGSIEDLEKNQTKRGSGKLGSSGK